ncbi:3-dehydroquinate synthase [Desulfohalovibrio reitneri]|uniref:3-dehydroquinate synthase n=1 Tax=Desulfohalovibrio reitneri TaxID=1307759 RepID=UPI0004A77D3D|nr:3-dehydroquinate synthase [Desulfohalovibrio reitneri]
MEEVRVCLRREEDLSYDIRVGPGQLDRVADDLAARPVAARYLVLTDATVGELYAGELRRQLVERGLCAGYVEVRPGEESKSLAVLERVLSQMLAQRVDRGDCLLAVGGGVVGDLGGFAAGCYMRGIPFAQVPTTLLSQVDSSVGGKTAVNLPGAKNACGLFHQPARVYADVRALATLPEFELRSGLAEVVKYALIADEGFAAYLEENARSLLALEDEAATRTVAACCSLKAGVVERDERESGPRMILNYGHTIGHALEDISSYGLSHGEAVAYGMRCMSRLAGMTGMLSPSDQARHDRLLNAFGLATRPLDLDVDRVLAATATDKKARGGVLRLVVPTALGRVEVRDDVDRHLLRRAVAETLADPA